MLTAYVAVFDQHGFFMYSRKFKSAKSFSSFCQRAENFGLKAELMYQ
jgi:hypothetical protein